MKKEHPAKSILIPTITDTLTIDVVCGVYRDSLECGDSRG